MSSFDLITRSLFKVRRENLKGRETDLGVDEGKIL
jgi:hypothetical protein